MRYCEIVANETQRAGSLDKISTKFVNQNLDKWKSDSNYVADMDDFKIKQDGMFYTVWDNDTLALSSSLNIDQSPPIVDHVWINPAYRGQHLFSKIMWFYKTRLGHSQLLLGSVHSKDMVEVLKYMPRFHKFWVKDNQKIPYDSNTIDQFYSYTEPTGWLILLENNGIFNWQKINTGWDYIKESYDWCYRLD